MLDLNESIAKAKEKFMLVLKVTYFNESIEYYVSSFMPDKNQFIPDGYGGSVDLVQDFRKVL